MATKFWICFLLFGTTVYAATTKASVLSHDKYQLNLRFSVKRGIPISVNTIAKPGKKSRIIDISNDGRTETFVEMLPKLHQSGSNKGLHLDFIVKQKTLHSKKSFVQSGEIIAFEDRESEIDIGSKRKPDLTMSVLAKQIN